MRLPRVLILDDVHYWCEQDRRLLCKMLALKDADAKEEHADSDYLAEAVFHTPQKRTGGAIVNDVELGLRAVEDGWREGVDRWALVLLDLHFAYGQVTDGALQMGVNWPSNNDSNLGYEVLRRMAQKWPDPTDSRLKTSVPVIALSSQPQKLEEERLNELGCLDFLSKSIDSPDRYALRRRFAELLNKHGLLQYDQVSRLNDEGSIARGTGSTANATVHDGGVRTALHTMDRPIIGRSIAMLKALRSARATAVQVDKSCLLWGPTGTGKELLAYYIHRHSNRQAARYGALNCGAIPSELVESELFGHTRNAFTGATAAREGLFRHCNHGTLFLDEIGNMSLGAQEKVLRAIGEGKIRPVGEDRELDVDVRLLAATNFDLCTAIERGLFRSDLYYRITKLELRVPSLAERPEDVPLLFEHFLRCETEKIGGRWPKSIRPEVHDLLRTYSWPGNVRELKNISERIAFNRKDAHRIVEGDLPSQLVLPTKEHTANATSRGRGSEAGADAHEVTVADAISTLECVAVNPAALHGILPDLESAYGKLLGRLLEAALEVKRDHNTSHPHKYLGDLSPTNSVGFLRGKNVSTNKAIGYIVKLGKLFPSMTAAGENVRKVFEWAAGRQSGRSEDTADSGEEE